MGPANRYTLRRNAANMMIFFFLICSQYPFEQDTVVMKFLDRFGEHLQEEELWELSLSIKPRVHRPKRPPFVPVSWVY